MSFYDAIRVGASGAVDFEVERSLRFNGPDGAFLERTPSSSSNKRTMTFSFWFKRAVNDSFTTVFRSFGNASNRHGIDFVSGGQLRLWGNYNGSVAMTVQPTQVFRDFSAWYHFVLAIDTTQGTASNRVKMYINGDQITDFATATYPSQNFDFGFNDSNAETQIGTDGGTTCNFYLAEFHEIDGLQLTPSSFAETNADTGQWVPKDTSALTFGTNGFRLKFADNSGTTATTLGKDSSGNGNNFTPNNFSVAAGVGNDSLEDTPTNNFCTLNPLSLIGTGGTITNGNLDFTGDSNYSTRAATFSLKTGKWYWEGTPTSVPSASAPQAFGIVRGTNIGSNSYIGYDPNGNVAGFGYFDGGSIKGAAGVGSTSGNNLATGQTTYTQNDVIGLASDIANGTLAFYKNGTLVYTITGISSFDWFPAQTTYSTGGKNSVNFGQRPFAHTPPTGHQALCSANLPDPTILLPNKHFDTLLYTGNGSDDRDITGLDFSPDWLWIKERNSTSAHCLVDSVRGSTKRLASSSTFGETTETNTVQSFLSNGFQVGTDGAVNENNKTYVAWNWNGGDTDSATYTVKVVSDSGNKYRFNNFGTSAVTLDLAEGGTYTFDGSDSSMSGHPFVIGTAANGSVYSTGVTYQLDGVSVTYSAYTSGYSSATTRKLIITVPASAPQLYYWCSIHSGMGGAINTNSTLGSSNFDGTIQTTVKVNATAGFSAISYSGNGTNNSTVGHGLGVQPDAIITKTRTADTNWMIYHNGNNLGVDPEDYFLEFSVAAATNAPIFADTAPTSTVVTLNGGDSQNKSGGTHIMYCFSAVEGYSKFGRYIGNANSDGPFIFTGFSPAYVLIKNSSAVFTNWCIKTAKISTFNRADKALEANTNTAEQAAFGSIDFLSNGFKVRNSGGSTNGSGNNFVYFAYAELPFKNSRAR